MRKMGIAVGLMGLLGLCASAHAATKSYTYSCRLLSPNGPSGVRIRISTTSATLSMDGAPSERYAFDGTYTPRGTSTDLRYRLHVARWILVEKDLPRGGYALRTGGRGGYMRLQLRDEGLMSWRYICRR